MHSPPRSATYCTFHIRSRFLHCLLLCPALRLLFFFFLNDPPPPEFSPLSLHDPLPICLFRFGDPHGGVLPPRPPRLSSDSHFCRQWRDHSCHDCFVGFPDPGDSAASRE